MWRGFLLNQIYILVNLKLQHFKYLKSYIRHYAWRRSRHIRPTPESQFNIHVYVYLQRGQFPQFFNKWVYVNIAGIWASHAWCTRHMPMSHAHTSTAKYQKWKPAHCFTCKLQRRGKWKTPNKTKSKLNQCMQHLRKCLAHLHGLLILALIRLFFSTIFILPDLLPNLALLPSLPSTPALNSWLTRSAWTSDLTSALSPQFGFSHWHPFPSLLSWLGSSALTMISLTILDLLVPDLAWPWLKIWPGLLTVTSKVNA